jgi:ribosomal protein L11 methyltransferase
MDATGWMQVSVSATAAQVDGVEEVLWEAGAHSVSLEDEANHPLLEPAPGELPLWPSTRVIGLFADETAVEQVLIRLGQRFADLPRDAVAVERLPDQDWIRAGRSHTSPQRFGERLWVCPSWIPPPQPEAINLILDPGLAFGSGNHPTTRLCLRWLAAEPPIDRRVLDYGCGSGILAVAALKLGASQAWAIDIDPQACEATRENGRRNAVPPAHLQTGSPEACPDAPFELIIANILAGPLIELAPTLGPRLAAQGRLVISGILADQVEAVTAAYAPWSALAWVDDEEDWCLLAGSATSADAPR